MSIEELSVEQTEPGGAFNCDLCETEVSRVDWEWLGPGVRLYLYRCPECERETVMRTQTGTVAGDGEYYAEQLVRWYTESDMSIEALERSIERAFGMDVQTEHEAFDSYLASLEENQ